MTVDGDPTTGKFDDVNPIPVTMGTEHILSATIEFEDIAMSYDFADTSAENNYGWGQSFNGTNNKIAVTNNSTCPVDVECYLNIDTETYPCLSELLPFHWEVIDNFGQYIYIDETTECVFSLYVSESSLSHSASVFISCNKELKNRIKFDNVQIGEITIELTPVWQKL